MPLHEISSTGETIWIAYTPSWTGSGSNPAIGNGSITGRYIILGKLCHFAINIVMGSTTTFGTGTYSYGLPPGAVAKTGGVSQLVIGYGFDSGTAHRVGAGRVSAAGTQVADIVDDDGTTGWGTTVPHTWANGDEIRIQGIIEID